MAAEITITIKCGNCRHSVPRPNRLLPECKMGRVQGTLCDRWIPFRKSIRHKIWMADNPASNKEGQHRE